MYSRTSVEEITYDSANIFRNIYIISAPMCCATWKLAFEVEAQV